MLIHKGVMTNSITGVYFILFIVMLLITAMFVFASSAIAVSDQPQNLKIKSSIFYSRNH